MTDHTDLLTRIESASDLKELILKRHAGRGAVLIEELRIGCGFSGGAKRRIDVWAIEANATKGCTATAYEIKVSRGDFRRDLADPLKQRGARLFSDQFYYVAPAGLIKRDEVPDWAGLLEPRMCGSWLMLQEVVPAPIRSKDAPSWPLVVSLLRREPLLVDAPALKALSERE